MSPGQIINRGNRCVEPNGYLVKLIGAFVACGVDSYDKTNDGLPLMTELDSHANKPVVGKHCCVLSEVGKTVEVSAFTYDYPEM